MEPTQKDLDWASTAVARLLKHCAGVVADELEQLARELRGCR